MACAGDAAMTPRRRQPVAAVRRGVILLSSAGQQKGAEMRSDSSHGSSDLRLARRTCLGGIALAVAAAAAPRAARAATGAPPPVAPQYLPHEVAVRGDLAPGTIYVLSDRYFLYYILRPGVALRYGVAVGRAELQFRGATEVARKVEWPSWTPTPDMIRRNPGAYARYADGMPGGPKNPLGARALYLYQDGFDTTIRIHGTTEPRSIGSSVSNGCIRMVNEHVIDLYDRVTLGTRVVVY